MGLLGRLLDGSSYQSASDHRVQSGWPTGNGATLEVRWPSGTVQVLKEMAADRILEVVEPSAEARQ